MHRSKMKPRCSSWRRTRASRSNPRSAATACSSTAWTFSARIRERDVTDGASKASVHPQVREWMVARQREMGLGGGVVMEGRDIGTKVFPDADLKIFLDADPVIREQRRLDQHKIKGASAESIAAELRERDRRDRTRAASPLVPANDAVVVDSTNLTEDEVVARIERLAEEKLASQS